MVTVTNGGLGPNEMPPPACRIGCAVECLRFLVKPLVDAIMSGENVTETAGHHTPKFNGLEPAPKDTPRTRGTTLW